SALARLLLRAPEGHEGLQLRLERRHVLVGHVTGETHLDRPTSRQVEVEQDRLERRLLLRGSPLLLTRAVRGAVAPAPLGLRDARLLLVCFLFRHGFLFRW